MLEALREEDLLLVLSWRNAPEVRGNMYSAHEISVVEHMNWYQETKNDPSRLDFIYSDEGRKCGVVYFTQLSIEKRTAFWGFYAASDAPKGTGLKMEYAALEHAFSVLGLHKLNCEVIAFNRGVINMHKKTGFVEEGLFRDFHFDGATYHDVIRFGMLASEWEQCRPALLQRIARVG
ncbi:MAG: UDP-4-amino-4,6-dideoxy-N-acetyl-beta-L-altrosamine N-acetyltransferase [Gammaproteobacteria bacterium]|nr:UDP-4-amino-4,6-dideoxy-N-acetyl-beta-L-altrosamine N-acetyltransferase [Gammaproteobacteria bacterium]